MSITRRYDDGLEMRVLDRGVRWQMTLMQDGESVSGLGLVKKRIRIGDAVVKMGGIAGVWTADKHWKKGYASRVMWESVELMKQKGYETSILFGIRDFYHRYGFVEAFPESSIELAADRLRSDGKLQTRIARKADLPAMAKLFPSPLGHVEVSFAENRHGIVPGYSVPKPYQKNYCYADPITAYKKLFQCVIDPSSLIIDNE